MPASDYHKIISDPGAAKWDGPSLSDTPQFKLYLSGPNVIASQRRMRNLAIYYPEGTHFKVLYFADNRRA